MAYGNTGCTEAVTPSRGRLGDSIETIGRALEVLEKMRSRALCVAERLVGQMPAQDSDKATMRAVSPSMCDELDALCRRLDVELKQIDAVVARLETV